MPVCRCVQAGDVRTSIGSGLIQLGLHPKSAVGLYSINSKGECSGEEEGGDCVPGERRGTWDSGKGLVSLRMCGQTCGRYETQA